MHLYKASEWENGGRWYVNDIEELGAESCKWYAPARMLGLAKEEYINLLKNDFDAGYIRYSDKHDVLTFSFDTQAKARKFKNFLNKEARFKHFMCGREY